MLTFLSSDGFVTLVLDDFGEAGTSLEVYVSHFDRDEDLRTQVRFVDRERFSRVADNFLSFLKLVREEILSGGKRKSDGYFRMAEHIWLNVENEADRIIQSDKRYISIIIDHGPEFLSNVGLLVDVTMIDEYESAIIRTSSKR